jgi:hypothetical protein
MLTATEVMQRNPGSRLYEAGGIEIVIRAPESQHWDLYVDARRQKPADARKMLMASVIFPSRDDLDRLLERKPALQGKLENLIINLVAPELKPLIDSDEHVGAQMAECDGVRFHLRPPTRKEFDAFEDGSKISYSNAATRLVTACLLSPDLPTFDAANEAKPGLKIALCGHLLQMAGADLEFTEKK